MNTGRPQHGESGTSLRRAVTHGIITVTFARVLRRGRTVLGRATHHDDRRRPGRHVHRRVRCAVDHLPHVARRGRWQVAGASWFLLAAAVMTMMATAPALLE